MEKALVEREQNGLRVVQGERRTLVPVASLSALLLGPGVNITHAAILVAGDAGCSVVWCGEQGVRFYASGGGDDRRCTNLHHQASVWADENSRLDVVKRLYKMRFDQDLGDELTLQQIRGMEGVRVRDAYARLSKLTGVEWRGRRYKRGDWANTDPVNQALSAANACLHALCHSAITIAGYNDSLGFIHSGKSRAFVYDIADLYKISLMVPLAFHAAKQGPAKLSSRVRRTCRAAFHQEKLLQRIIPDIQRALGQRPQPVQAHSLQNPAPDVLDLWDPQLGLLSGGQNHANDSENPSEDGVPF